MATLHFEYPDDAMKTWQALWGQDFISPGGAEETRQILGDLDLTGKHILEVGSGWGGPSLLFAKERGAASVVGIDLQEKVIEKTNRRAAELGVADRVTFKHVSSLSWPFPDNTFDVVFSKDALLHTEDKHALYAEIYRVLKPGGRFVYADWFGCDQPPTPEFQQWLKDNDFTMVLKSLGFTVDLCIRLGFTEISVEDRCEWFKEMFARDAETLKGPVGEELAKDFGKERLLQLRKDWFEPCVVLADQGQLRLGTFRATKPL